MATIKSFTDLPQSKVLAKILPLESADMYWDNSDTGGRSHTIHIGKSIAIERNFLSYKLGGQVCAWSLAALLGILPNNEKETSTLSRGGWKIDSPEYLNNWWCEYEDDSCEKDFSVSADNPIDACYEMILKLHEMKKL